MRKIKLLILFALILSLSSTAQQKAIGVFDGQTDIGKITRPGSGIYKPATRQYIVSGAGNNTRADNDAFHFVYKKMKGDFILYTRAEFASRNGAGQHRKIGWMIRKSLEDNSTRVNAEVNEDGRTSLRFRRTAGTTTEELTAKTTHANIIQLERTGNTYTLRVAKFGEPFVTEEVAEIELGDEVYAGLFAGSDNAEISKTGVFRDVRITVPFAGIADQRTQMTLGSDLEIMEVATGNREIIYSTPYSIQAPNWMPDNKSLIFNSSKGVLYNFNLATRKATLLNTGTITNNNNDHVLSFDGKMIGLSSSVKELGGSIVYTVPATGGIPTQITPKGPSYMHGWSPDGKDLVFCGDRDGEFDVYRVSASGGPETRLTTAKGLDDGPEYSPDGKFIYFNSVRSGLMQIWRMKPDGSDQEQVTSDAYDNWFAHISPDGKSMVFLTFLPTEVEPGIHPPYKHVYIRILPVTGGTPKVLAYFYGGQGSMNTPSWSPDSKHIAFISNTSPVPPVN